MHVEWIVLDAFGPFRDRRLTLAPGLNVVYGPNEAGKSTLHAALVTGLCGVRRARGRGRDESEFEERHRPWTGNGWKLRLGIRLADDRRIELVQDLEHKDQCRAYDADLGRDVTHELAANDWTPDATRWLGLDHRAFRAMASVRQSELQALRDHAGTLREFVQRAVATAGTDGTAAAAIERIEHFLREHVGVRAAHSTKPLRRAQQQLEAAQTAYDRARVDHEQYVQGLEHEAAHVARVTHAAHDVRMTQAARAVVAAAAQRDVVDRVRALQRRHPEGPPPERAGEDLLARDVDRALQAWDARPAAAALTGASVAELQRERDALLAMRAHSTLGTRVAPASPRPAPIITRRTAPTAPDAWAIAAPAISTELPSAAPTAASTATFGDDEPAPEIRAAAARFEAARDAVRTHAAVRPQVAPAPPGGNVTLAELQRLAAQLATVEPTPDTALDSRSRGLEIDAEAAQQTARAARAIGFLLGALALIGGAIVAGAGRWTWMVGPALMAVGAVIAFTIGLRRGHAMRVFDTELTRANDVRRQSRARRDAWESACDEARERALELSLPPDAPTLHRLAIERAHWDENRHQLAAWHTAHTQLVRDFERLEDDLRVLLRDRGVPAGPDLSTDVVTYEQACRARRKHQDLEEHIERRARDEAVADDIAARRAAAAAAVRDVAARCSLPATDPEAVIESLRAWLETRGRALAVVDRARQEWAELQALLRGRSLFDLEDELAQAENRVVDLARGLDVQHLRATARGDDDLALRERTLADAERALALVRAELQRHPAQATPLADAEDDLRAAESELQRVEALEASLRTAQRFLVQAQDRVHRDVAPLLADTVRTALPAITGGRWRDARVDPETLDVAVQDATGGWRRAALLSHGTAEQVYLLLRAALVRHLARRGESCPLLLDDATVQFDHERKRAALETLHSLSHDRQIIVFTQEDAVLDWAQARLAPPRDAVIALTASA
jgi:hypothetical protein